MFRFFWILLFGNEDFSNKSVENITSDGCIITFEITYPIYSHAFKRIYVKYDLNKKVVENKSYLKTQKALFLDRDNTIIHCPENKYINKIEEIKK